MIGKAKAANMTKDRIDAAIKRGTDSKEGNRVQDTCALPWSASLMLSTCVLIAMNAEVVLYEGSGPAGSAFMVSYTKGLLNWH